MSAIRSGGALDLSRAAQYVLRWWREGGHVKSALNPDASADPPFVRGWGLDFYFGGRDIPLAVPAPRKSRQSLDTVRQPNTESSPDADGVQAAMDNIVDNYVASLEEKQNGIGISANQQKKKERDEKQRDRDRRRASKYGS